MLILFPELGPVPILRSPITSNCCFLFLSSTPCSSFCSPFSESSKQNFTLKSHPKKLQSAWQLMFVHSTVTSASLILPVEAIFFTARNTLASPAGRPSGVSVGEKTLPRAEKEASFTVSVRNYYFLIIS